MHMLNLVAEINRALRTRGWSARKASLEAVGSPELIRDMRRGRLPSVERLQALCEVLDLEFYVGPRRLHPEIDERRLEEAVESAERILRSNAGIVEPQVKARAVAAIYQLLDRDREPATADRLQRLIGALSTERRASQPQEEPRERSSAHGSRTR